MNVSELVEISLAGIDSSRVEVETLEPAVISTEAVSALSHVVAELVENATAFSGPDQGVRMNGVFQTDDYLITISDDGVGIPESMLTALNGILQRPAPPSTDNEVSLGITMVARLAARHGIGVKLVPSVPGTTARILVPSSLVSRDGSPAPDQARATQPARGAMDDVFAESPQETIDLSRYERDYRPAQHQHVVSMTNEGRERAEVFLESVFGPLRGRAAAGTDRPVSRNSGNSGRSRQTQLDSRPPLEREPKASTSTLRVRVPGENFALDDDERSTASSEGAIDIRTALSRYDLGRRDARKSGQTG